MKQVRFIAYRVSKVTSDRVFLLQLEPGGFKEKVIKK